VSLVVDLTAEFVECRAVRTACRYISAPVLDTGVMDEAAFLALVQEVARWPGPVYIHCAQGHGRTGTFAAAVLLARGHCDTVDAAVAQLRAVRPGLALGQAQLQFVHRVAERLLPKSESAAPARPADATADQHSLA
jgi:protein-tyrosine phosphatase